MKILSSLTYSWCSKPIKLLFNFETQHLFLMKLDKFLSLHWNSILPKLWIFKSSWKDIVKNPYELSNFKSSEETWLLYLMKKHLFWYNDWPSCTCTYIEHMKYDNQRIIVELKKIIVDLNHLVHMDFVYNVFTNFLKCHTLNTGIKLSGFIKNIFICVLKMKTSFGFRTTWVNGDTIFNSEWNNHLILVLFLNCLWNE